MWLYRDTRLKTYRIVEAENCCKLSWTIDAGYYDVSIVSRRPNRV
jgi:hypothetical protein